MDEVRRLEMEINSLQAQLNQQNAQAAEYRRRYIDENRRNLNSYQQDMNQAIRNHDRNTQAEYQRRFEQYQKSLNRDVEKELAKTNSDYERLLNEVRRNEQALARKNKELEKAIADIRKDISKKNEGSSREASEYIYDAGNIYKKIDEKPHEKFMPNRLNIFLDEIKDGQELFKAGLYEASIAVSISAKSGLERLGYTIDDKVSEWERQFELFKMKLEFLETKIRQELVDWEEYVQLPDNNDKSLRTNRLIEINYWSYGAFAQVFIGFKQLNMIDKAVEKYGIKKYLKMPESVNTEQLEENIKKLDELDKQLESFSETYKNRYKAACQRADWGENIIDFLTGEINLQWHDELTEYKNADEEETKKQEFSDYVKFQFGNEKETQDMREWLKLVFENSSEDYIYIYIVPVEKQNDVKNRIIVHVDYSGSEQEDYSRDVYRHVCEAIQYEEPEDVVDYAGDSEIESLKYSSNKGFSETAKDIEKMKKQKIKNKK